MGEREAYIIEKSVVLGSVFWAGAVLYLSQFQALFREFDLPLPASTRFVLASYPWWGILMLAAMLGGRLLWRGRRRAGWLLVFTPLVIATILFPFAVWAMYAPVLATQS